MEWMKPFKRDKTWHEAAARRLIANLKAPRNAGTRRAYEKLLPVHIKGVR